MSARRRRPRGAPDGPRAAAHRAVLAVLDDAERLDTVLQRLQAPFAEERERALVRELVTGTVRWHVRLAALLEALAARPVTDRPVAAAVLLGLYQIEYTRVPPHAAVSTSVDLVRHAGLGRAAGLVNGMLRRFVRERQALTGTVDADPATGAACPAWLAEALRTAWPDDWQAVLTANNERAPLAVRVDARRITRDAYLARLQAAGLAADALPWCEHGLAVSGATAPAALPGLGDGLVTVQDGASQLAAPLLGAGAGERVLDACAAPGGKTLAIAACAPQARILALDSDAGRLQRLRDNLERAGASAEVRHGDAGDPTPWWDGRPFDRILVDAPCTATGIIRRHPDIRLRRRAGDDERLAAGQRRLLAGLWPLLRPGGTLLYATCSTLPVENADVMTDFLSSQPDARADAIDAPWGRAAGAGRQILPGEGHMDGFFYARLRKL